MSVDENTLFSEFAKPLSYYIYLKPNLETFSCEGHEIIDIKTTHLTTFLELHSHEIDVVNVSVKFQNGSRMNNLKFEHKYKRQTLVIHFFHSIDPQKFKLFIKFVAKHNDYSHGFYRSSFKTNRGEQKYLVCTQFESTYARMAFPCWDEPMYKARFNIVLEVDKNLTALSNMHVVSEMEENEKKIVTFATTPLMSTYLVAFAVGEFEFIESFSQSNIPIRVYTLPRKSHQAYYSLEVAVKSYDWLTNWFDFPQPLQKVDLLSVPDMKMGAMENWGLILFQDRFIIQDLTKTSFMRKMHNTIIISHEFTHFWFGNLVTMKWWTDLWLKEGFASFMSYMFTTKNYPEFDAWMHFLDMEMASAFKLDCLRSTHPIEVPFALKF